MKIFKQIWEKLFLVRVEIFFFDTLNVALTNINTKINQSMGNIFEFAIKNFNIKFGNIGFSICSNLCIARNGRFVMKPLFLVGGTMVSTEGKILDFRFSENSKNELSRNLKHSKYIPRFFSPLALVSSLVHLAHLVHYWFFQKKIKTLI